MRGPAIDRRRLLLASALGVAGWLVMPSAQAGADCTVSTAGVNFGEYDPTVATPKDAVGTLTISCTFVGTGGATEAHYQVFLSPGLSGDYRQRQMASGVNRLNYNLYMDAARTQLLGDNSNSTERIEGTLRVGPGVGNNTRTAAYSMYGRIPALQDAKTGSYADTIVATLQF